MAPNSLPSRREFIGTAATALAMFGMTRRPADEELLYVGTYTDGADINQGLHLVRFDTGTGALRRVGAINAGANPSFLGIHPNGRVLYAVNEVTTRAGKPVGGVSSFAIAEGTGDLSPLNEQSSEGGAPCYVSVDRAGRVALVANYVGGNLAVLPIRSDGALEVASHVVQHSGRGPKTQQDSAHAHFIATDPSNHFALAADLGVDRVFVYRLSEDARTLERVAQGQGVLRSGAGPRHIAFHPTLPLVFVANELDSTVTAFRFHDEIGALTPIDTRSSLPVGWSGTSYIADIHVSPSGRHVYVSNRGHNSIALFSVAETTGALTLEQTTSTSGDWPRNFTLDPTGDWLLVANQRSGDIVVFVRDSVTGRLTQTPNRIAITSPVCLRFRAHTGVTT